MGANKTKLSIVSPAFEEADSLPFFHEEIAAVLAPCAAEFDLEFVYVDDGSRDQTLEVLKTLARKDTRVRYLSLSRNFGKEAALTAGLEHADGDLVVTMDSDLQHPPAVIPQLLAAWRQGFDIVLTIRADDKRLGLVKRWTSRAYYKIMGLLSDTDIRPAGSDFRLMTRRVVDSLLQMRERHRFLRGLVRWLGYPTTEVAFTPDERKAGQTKYNFVRLLSLACDSMFSFSQVPLRISLILGMLVLAGSLFLGVGFVGHWLWTGAAPGVWALVFMSTLFLGGCILWAVGVVGEYVGRIFEQVKERPIYFLKDQSPAGEMPMTSVEPNSPARATRPAA